jgi:hypothetical protein
MPPKAATEQKTKIEQLMIFATKILTDYGIVIAIAIYLIVFSTFITKDTNELYSKKYFYTMSILIPFLIGFGYLIYSYGVISDTKELGRFAAITILLIGAIYLYNRFKISETFMTSMSFMTNIIMASIVIFAVIIFAKVFKDIAYSIEGIPGIIMRLLFFIPCMLADFFDFLIGQMKSSPFVVYVLIGIEILLVLAYFYLPKLAQMYADKDGHKILDKPEFLKNEKRLISYSELMAAAKIPITSEPKIKNEYAFSMWFYIVRLPQNQLPYNMDATIFEFVNQHPKITYNGKDNLCKVQISPVPADNRTFKIAMQKWVHCVVSYSINNVDIFINGELIATAPRTIKDVTEISDYIVVGQDAGLHGGICNVVHYNKSLLKMEIDQMYAINKDADPPIGF